MMGAIPQLYPDELLVSAWARYESWVRYPQRRALVEELFGDGKATVAFDLPGRLGGFTAALPPGHPAASADDLIAHHTLFPYYAAFLPAERQAVVRAHMAGTVGCNLHALLGLSPRAMHLPQRLRYCPACVVEDRERFGETYWHRLHQAVGVEVCPEHGVWLESADVPLWMVPGSVTFPEAESVIRSLPLRSLNLDVLPERQLLRLAQAAQWLLAHPDMGAETFQLRERGLLQLVARGWATYSGRLKQREITAAVETVWSVELLTRLGCHWTAQEETHCWVRRLLQTHDRASFVLHVLLLVLFYAEDIPAFLALPSSVDPFGAGPWPCLNPVCAYEGQAVIHTCALDYNAKGFPRGTFACDTCGFVYTRVGPDTQPDAVYRIGEVKTRGPLWETKLRQLWFDPQVTVRQMVSVMHSSWGHLRWQGTQLGLPFPPLGVRARRRTATPASPRLSEIAPDIARHRQQWLTTMREHPDWRVRELRQQAASLYSWLRYHDREWLLDHTPKAARQPRRPTDICWEQRDDELVAEMERAYEQLMARQPPLFRVTATAMLTALRRRGYYTRNHSRLPKSVARLNALAESHEAFALRKVWSVAHSFHVQGQVPRRRVLAEGAGVAEPPHCDNPRLQAAVDAALNWLKGDSGDDFIPPFGQQEKGVA